MILSQHPDVHSLFMDEQNMPLGLSSKTWAEILINIPSVGLIDEEYMGNTWFYLKELAKVYKNKTEVPKHILEEFEYWDEDSGEARSLGFLEGVIICSEQTPEDPFMYINFDIKNGQVLVSKHPQAIDGCTQYNMSRPYDSKNYPIKTSTVYIQGEFDPQTTLESARYHYEHNLSPKKVFIEVKNGGHTPRQHQLAVCFPELLNIVDKDIKLDFSKIITKIGHCRKEEFAN